MSGLDRILDPASQDYVDGENGEFGETPTIASGCYHQLTGQRNTWPGDPDAGSDLPLVLTRNLDRSTVVFAQDAIRRALQPFVDAGEATDIEVAARANSTGRLILESSITDVQSGRIDLTDIAPIGEE